MSAPGRVSWAELEGDCVEVLDNQSLSVMRVRRDRQRCWKKRLTCRSCGLSCGLPPGCGYRRLATVGVGEVIRLTPTRVQGRRSSRQWHRSCCLAVPKEGAGSRNIDS